MDIPHGWRVQPLTSGSVSRKDAGKGPPTTLPCGCTEGRRCAEAARLETTMNAAARAGNWPAYGPARQAFFAHYSTQTGAPAAVLKGRV